MKTEGLTMDSFAQTIEVSQTTVDRWINGGKQPSSDSLLRIYETFGLEPMLIMKIQETAKDIITRLCIDGKAHDATVVKKHDGGYCPRCNKKVVGKQGLKKYLKTKGIV